MRAMLRKDWYVMGRYAAYLILSWLLVVWAAIRFLESDARFLYRMLPVFSLTIVLNSVSADENRWDRFAVMMPLRPWRIVVAKYLFAYAALAVMTALAALAGGGGELWVVAVLASLALATSLPLLYRLGRRRGGMALLLLWGLAAAVILGMAYFQCELIDAAFGWIDEVPFPLLALGGGSALLALNAGSFVLSVRFYARRRRGWYD